MKIRRVISDFMQEAAVPKIEEFWEYFGPESWRTMALLIQEG